MLVVRTSVKLSKINGVGVFADEKIPKGAVIWRFHPQFDILFEPSEVEKMPELQKNLILHYAYLSMTTGKYVYSIDNTRFINHSSINENMEIVDVPNEPETQGVAKNDIEIGEELLINYREFDVNDAVSDAEYLKK